MNQPEALRLAFVLESHDPIATERKAAAELRRQHGELERKDKLIAELQAAAFSAVAILNWLERRSLYQDLGMKATHDQLRAAIAKATE